MHDELNREIFNFIDTYSGPKTVPQLCGWVAKDNPKILREAFDMLGEDFPRLSIKGSRPIKGARSMLWEVMRKVLGADTPNYPQEIGDCISFGAKNAIEYVQGWPIANGARKVFKRVYPPYLYSTGRVFIGKGQIGRQDGSLGIWQAKAVMQFGTIPIDTPGCPPYSGSIAKDWGYNGPPDQFVKVGKEHIIKSAALVRTWEDVVTALVNGYPVTIASNVGFDMTPRSDGFNHNSTSWGHQMCIVGVDNEYQTPYACILNSWGDAHGTIKDFKTGEIWPKGTLRVLQEDVEKILSEGDSFAYSAFDGFPAQTISRDLFDFI